MITYFKSNSWLFLRSKIIPIIIYTLFILIFLQGIHSLWNLAYYSVGKPFGGFLITWSKEERCLIVHPITSPDWPGVQPGLLQPYDCILKAGSFVYDDPSYGAKERELANIVAAQRETYDDIVVTPVTMDYTVRRNGENLEVNEVPVIIFTWEMYWRTVLPRAILGFSLLALAFVVFQANPVGEVNILFSITTLYITTTYAFLAIYDSLVGYAFNTNVWKYISGLMPLLIGTVLHLGIAFPAPEKTSRLFRLRYLIYCVPVILAIPFMLTFIWSEHSASPQIFEYLLWLVFLTITASFGFICWRCYKLYTTQASPRIKQQAFYMMIGWGIGVIPAWGLYGFHYFTGWLNTIFIDYLPFLLLLFSICVSFATLRYKLFFGHTETLKYLLLISISLFLSIVYYIVLDSFRVVRSDGTVLLILLLTTVTTSAFWLIQPVKLLFSDFFLRLLNREQGDLQIITQLNENLYKHTANLNALTVAIAESLYQSVEADNPRIWLTDVNRGGERQAKALICYYPKQQAKQQIDLPISAY